MNLKPTIGALIGYLYNEWLAKVPFHLVRECYLNLILGAFGKGSAVQLNCRFLNAPKVFFGKGNVINFGCLFDGRKHEIKIGDNVSIGPEAAILTLGHDPQSEDFSDRGGDVVVGDRAWICFRAIILPGVTIGEGAIVGAGSTVSRDVEPYTIVAGTPAKVIGQRNRDLTYDLKFRPWLR